MIRSSRHGASRIDFCCMIDVSNDRKHSHRAFVSSSRVILIRAQLAENSLYPTGAHLLPSVLHFYSDNDLLESTPP
jgi:hypothetical protein